MTDACSDPYDVCVIGAGVVGTAVARVLSHHRLRVVLADAAADVSSATSKANTAILHTGFDATPGTLESRLVARGYELLSAYAPTVGIAVEQTGALLVAWDDDQAASLAALADKARVNGYTAARLVDSGEVRSLEPNLADGAAGGMIVPDEHIIDPWGPPLAFAEEAIVNAATWLANFRVVTVDIGPSTTLLTAADGRSVRTRFVVNAAGLHSDTVNVLAGLGGFVVRPRRGELIVFDKLARPLLSRTILPVPTAGTKGVLVAPTVFGNVMLGPTAEDIDDRSATGSTRSGIDSLLASGRRIMPRLLDEEVTAVYAGLRAATEHLDYQVIHDRDRRYVCLGGIRSTGLTSSMALAEHTLVLLAACGLQITAKDPDEIRCVHVANLGENSTRAYQLGGHGRIVCHCELVTEDEIVAACTSTLPATNVDGLRRRTRALGGRCQGFFCAAEVCSIAATATGRALGDWIGVP